MQKSGYDQFFQAAKKNSQQQSSKPSGARAKIKMSSKSKRLKAKEKKRKERVPWSGVSALALGLVIAICGLLYIDDLDELISHVEISPMTRASAQSTTSPAVKKEETTAQSQKKMTTAEQVKSWNEKDLEFLSKLDDRKKELDRREQNLEQMELELQKQKKMIDQKITELQRMRQEISKILKNRIDMDNEKINKLVDFYSNMKPAQAAQVFAEINEDLAVEVLGRMKKKNAAAIMNLLKPDKAQVLSEKFAGYRAPASE